MFLIKLSADISFLLDSLSKAKTFSKHYSQTAGNSFLYFIRF